MYTIMLKYIFVTQCNIDRVCARMWRSNIGVHVRHCFARPFCCFR